MRDAPLQGLRARLDLTGEAPGERTWFLGTEAVEAPSGVQVMRVDPSQVILRLDRTLTSTVRVSPRVLGQPATGFEIHNVVIEPLELAVEGPESLLRDTAQITTEPIFRGGAPGNLFAAPPDRTRSRSSPQRSVRGRSPRYR